MQTEVTNQIQEQPPVQPALPIAWPKDAKDVRDFFHADFITAQFAAADQTPCNEDRYLISAHDFLSAVNWWANFPHVSRTPQAAPLPLLMRDIARDHGITALEACQSLKDLGNFSVNTAVTAEMAAKLRELFPVPQAAPAAVAVPDELIRAAKQALACMDGLQQHLGRAVCQVEADALRAALAATPAAAPVDKSPVLQGSMVDKTVNLQGSAAAPVVLPEPDGFLESHPLGSIYHRGKPSQMQTFCGACPPMYEAGTVHALLATATGLPAQAPMQCVECNSCGTAYDIDGYQAGFTDGKGHCPECPGVHHAAPQAAPAAVAVQQPENIREGAPYDAPEFEQLARDLGVWGTAQSAVCAQFWMAAQGSVAPVVLPEPDAAISKVMELVESYADAVASDMELQYEALEISIKSKLRALLATATGLPAQAVEPSDAELIALNAGECFFSESPSKYPELGHGTQYHGGAPGVIGFARAALELRADPAAYSQKFQQRVQPWMMACFGPEISADRRERNHRFLEEALELVQSCGCTASEAYQLVDFVFGRPVGDKPQEVGGVMVTLAALCLANGLDMHACGETELARIWTRVEAIRAKQAAKPKHSPLPMQAPQTQDALRLAFVLSEIRRDGMDALSAALHDLDGFPLDHQASVEAIDRAAIAAAKGEAQ